MVSKYQRKLSDLTSEIMGFVGGALKNCEVAAYIMSLKL